MDTNQFKKRNEKTQRERLANELIDAFENKGNSVKKKDEVDKIKLIEHLLITGGKLNGFK